MVRVRKSQPEGCNNQENNFGMMEQEKTHPGRLGAVATSLYRQAERKEASGLKERLFKAAFFKARKIERFQIALCRLRKKVFWQDLKASPQKISGNFPDTTAITTRLPTHACFKKDTAALIIFRRRRCPCAGADPGTLRQQCPAARWGSLVCLYFIRHD